MNQWTQCWLKRPLNIIVCSVLWRSSLRISKRHWLVKLWCLKTWNKWVAVYSITRFRRNGRKPSCHSSPLHPGSQSCLIVLHSGPNGLKTDLHPPSGFLGSSSLKLSSLQHSKTTLESTLLQLMNLHSILRSLMSTQSMKLQRNHLMEHTSMVCSWRALVGIAQPIFLMTQIQSNCTQKCQSSGLYLQRTERSQVVEFTTAPSTKCLADPEHSQQQVTQLIIVWCLRFQARRNRMSG